MSAILRASLTASDLRTLIGEIREILSQLIDTTKLLRRALRRVDRQLPVPVLRRPVRRHRSG